MKSIFAALTLCPLASCVFVRDADDDSEIVTKYRDERQTEVKWVDYGDDPMNPEFTAAMEKAATPGAEHAELAKGAGDYEVSGQCWMAPGAEPMSTTGTAHVEMLLGGRFLEQDLKAEWMGTAFEGKLLMGYDNLQEQYWSLWIDNCTTGYALASGEEQANGDIVLAGTVRDPKTPEGRPYRSVMKTRDDGSFTMTMFDTLPEGGEFKVMELVYKKK